MFFSEPLAPITTTPSNSLSAVCSLPIRSLQPQWGSGLFLKSVPNKACLFCSLGLQACGELALLLTTFSPLPKVCGSCHAHQTVHPCTPDFSKQGISGFQTTLSQSFAQSPTQMTASQCHLKSCNREWWFCRSCCITC